MPLIGSDLRVLIDTVLLLAVVWTLLGFVTRSRWWARREGLELPPRDNTLDKLLATITGPQKQTQNLPLAEKSNKQASEKQASTQASTGVAQNNEPLLRSLLEPESVSVGKVVLSDVEIAKLIIACERAGWTWADIQSTLHITSNRVNKVLHGASRNAVLQEV